MPTPSAKVKRLLKLEGLSLVPAHRVSNSTGFEGVSFHVGSGKYAACCSEFGSTRNLGFFDTADEAADTADEAADTADAALDTAQKAKQEAPPHSVEEQNAVAPATHERELTKAARAPMMGGSSGSVAATTRKPLRERRTDLL